MEEKLNKIRMKSRYAFSGGSNIYFQTIGRYCYCFSSSTNRTVRISRQSYLDACYEYLGA